MDFESIFKEAQTEAAKAFVLHKARPMIVGRAFGLVGSEIVPGTEEYIEDGVCGFAWVNLPGRQPFAKWLKKEHGCTSDWPKGIHLSFYKLCPQHSGSQSMEKKYAAARAACLVFIKHGIQCSPQQRID